MEPVAILKHALVEQFNRAMMFLFDSDMETAEGMRYRENELVLEPGVRTGELNQIAQGGDCAGGQPVG